MTETLDQYNDRWKRAMSAASSVRQLTRMLAEAKQSEHWNGKLAKHGVHILLLLAGPDGSRYYRAGKRS